MKTNFIVIVLAISTVSLAFSQKNELKKFNKENPTEKLSKEEWTKKLIEEFDQNFPNRIKAKEDSIKRQSELIKKATSGIMFENHPNMVLASLTYVEIPVTIVDDGDRLSCLLTSYALQTMTVQRRLVGWNTGLGIAVAVAGGAITIVQTTGITKVLGGAVSGLQLIVGIIKTQQNTGFLTDLNRAILTWQGSAKTQSDYDALVVAIRGTAANSYTDGLIGKYPTKLPAGLFGNQCP